MKKNKVFSLFVAALTLGFTACNNSSDEKASTGDSATSTAENASASSANSNNDYSAFADSVERNSQAGHYLNAKTGKPLKLKVNRSTGEILDETTGEPVWHYVDNRNWWVYGIDDSDWYWDTMGEAHMEKDQLMYKDDNGKWVDYDVRWKSADEKITKGWKEKSGNTKIKVSKDGDIKVKDESGKTKYDADDNKIKTDTSK